MHSQKSSVSVFAEANGFAVYAAGGVRYKKMSLVSLRGGF